MHLHLEDLELLDLIEGKGSFAAAAQSLNKAPSAISYQLRQLEDQLDVLIFDRSGHKAKLTPAGRVLLEEGRQLLRASQQLSTRVKAVGGGWEPELRIVLDSLIPFDLAVQWIKEFDALKAPTRLRFSTEVLSGTWEAVYTRQADLLIGGRLDQNQMATTTGMHVNTIGHAWFVFAVSPSHPLVHYPQPISNETLTQFRAIAVGDTARNFKPLTFGLQQGQEVLTVPSLRDKLQAQIEGLGCGWLPWHLAKDAIAKGKLVVLQTEELSRKTPLCVAWPRGASGKALGWWTEFLSHQRIELGAESA